MTVEDDVEGSGGYQGTLRVFEVSEDTETLVHKEAVAVAFAARFGPDVADVNFWQERALDAIDNPDHRRVDDQ